MNLTALIEKLQGLPEDKQTEVIDFVDYLSSRFTREGVPRQTDWTNGDFSLLSINQAMRGMEDEPDLYAPSDLKERW